MARFEQANKIRPPETNDTILRWNRCVRPLHTLPSMNRRKNRLSLTRPIVHWSPDSSPRTIFLRRYFPGALKLHRGTQLRCRSPCAVTSITGPNDTGHCGTEWEWITV